MNKWLVMLAAVTMIHVVGAARVSDVEGRALDEYVEAMLANGRLGVYFDYTLGSGNRNDAKHHFSPGIWWEGRRFGDNNGQSGRFGYELIPQGQLRTVVEENGKALPLEHWSQSLEVRQALGAVENQFANGLKLCGEMFVPRSRDVIAIRQQWRNESPTVTRRLSLGIAYAAPKHERLVGEWRAIAGGAEWRMTAYARYVTHETIRISGSALKGTMPEIAGGQGERRLVVEVELKPGEARTLDWFIEYEDDLEKSMKPITPVAKQRGEIAAYDEMKRVHLADWAAYFAESEVRVPDGRIQTMHDMACYHLRCVSTEWSIPIGILQSHWQGKIFAFDEMYGVQGLVSAGHFAAAKVAPDFRAATLTNACLRCNRRPKEAFYNYGARWVWEAAEGNDRETSPLGYWMDHIFQQAAIAQTVWTYCQYTGDREYLRQKGYDVIRECALFFRRLQVVDLPDGTSFVNKCTDLERMGPGKERAFMTTCGVIATLRAAASAAEQLGRDMELVKDWRACANRLVASLPEKDGRYIAYPDSTDESLGTLAGFYPFHIFGRDNQQQIAAVRHFLDNGQAVGNMYETGKRICPWYAATMAIASLRAGDNRQPAIRWLQEAYRSSGGWGEFWEINEPGVSQYRPWFMTAAGNVLNAINQLLVTEIDGELLLAEGVPEEWKDFAFRLPVPGGGWATLEVAGGEVRKLQLDPGIRERFRAVKVRSEVK